MRVILMAALAVSGSGCFSSWTAIQIGNVPAALDESVREASVPQPGVRERLRVRMPLVIEYDQPLTPAGSTSTTASPRPPATPRVFALACETTQQATDTVYRSAYRYGTKWKYAAATMFVLETAAAAAFFYSDRSKPENTLASAMFAIDALGTAVLFFAPRKEIYRHDTKPVTTIVRDDCPDGLALDIGGEVFPVDAAGRVGELGLAALDAWMRAPTAPVRLTYGDQRVDLPLRTDEQCSWNQQHHPELPSSCPRYGTAQSAVSVTLEVPMGTLTRVSDDTAAR
ncbi:MAG: hypothetical protein H0T79_20880 [Deltaproteobacteria bacterium]|nr:hypothetical protein [Deltaproteobacteria bacterium]